MLFSLGIIFYIRLAKTITTSDLYNNSVLESIKELLGVNYL